MDKSANLAADLAKPSTTTTIGTSIKSGIQWLAELAVSASVQIALKGS
jgi:hypothetical protein